MNDEHIVFGPRIAAVIDVIAEARVRRLRAATNPPPSPEESEGAAARDDEGAEPEVAGDVSTRNDLQR